MSIVNGNGKGNLLISYLFPEGSTLKEQCDLENELKNEFAKILHQKKLKFIIGDDEFINRKFLD